jgi:nicotinamidase/pyrazinamidase
VANGFRTRVLLGLTAGVAPGSTSEAIESLRGTGVDVAPA